VIERKGRGDLTALSNEFYTLIPHNFGMRRPEIIGSAKLLKAKLSMVEQLADIEIATKLLSSHMSDATNVHPIDIQYHKLKCNLLPLEPNCSEVNMINKYIQNTHAKTHNTYSLEVLEVFGVDREGETENYHDFSTNENRMLLWHGSRLTNFVGILSQGLRIAPPEAPVTGYMFGKGVYFADMVSKSANYCNTSRSSDIGVLLLCEVALGETNDLYQADYNADRLPDGKLSTKGCGKEFPDPKQAIKLDNGCIVPCGTPLKGQLPQTSVLLYNEFIVYSVSQVKIRYLVKMRFDYK